MKETWSLSCLRKIFLLSVGLQQGSQPEHSAPLGGHGGVLR